MPSRRNCFYAAPRRWAVALATLACIAAPALGACGGDTLQDQPVGASTLEKLLITGPYPIYWLGGAFHAQAITAVNGDPGGAFTIQYGDCIEGGQSTCVTPLSIVTSPDNSFRPGGSTPTRIVRIRGVHGVLAQQGQTIELRTAGVLVEIYAARASLAMAAAETMVPINRIGAPGMRLPPPLPETGFAQKPLPTQAPSVARVTGALLSR
jgi:hypothetical protein